MSILRFFLIAILLSPSAAVMAQRENVKSTPHDRNYHGGFRCRDIKD